MTERAERIFEAAFVAVGGLAFGGIIAVMLGNPDPWHHASITAGGGVAGWLMWNRWFASR